MLLLQARDPADAGKGHWWEIPGGGMDPGETSAEAARRELFEETGIVEAEIGPCVWTQHARFRFAGWKFDQHEHVHVAWTDRIDRVLTHRVWGTLIFLVLMFVVFQAIFTGAKPLMDLVGAGKDWLAGSVSAPTESGTTR